jgi:hypothetical protein
MWLRDEVAKTAKRARVLLYGYDTMLVNSESFQDIGDIATRLSSDVNAIRGARSVSISCLKGRSKAYSFPGPRGVRANPDCFHRS